jgi:hypothetical protein
LANQNRRRPDWFEENAPPGQAVPRAGAPASPQNQAQPRAGAITDAFKTEMQRRAKEFLGGRTLSDEQLNDLWRSSGGDLPRAGATMADPNWQKRWNTAASTPGVTNGDHAAFGAAWQAWANANKKWNPAGLKEFIAANPGYGAEITGSKGDKVKIGGKEFDAIIAAGAGGTGASWYDLSSGGGGAAAPAAPVGGTLLEPWTAPFQYPSFEPPPAFQAPTSGEAFDDQGFKFTLARGREALEHSAAAKGTLLTTGTLRDLDAQSQGLASQQYDKVYGRKLGEYEQQYGHATTDYQQDYNKALGEYQQGYNIFNANQDRPFNKLTTLAGLGAGAGSQMLGAGGSYAGLYGNTLMNNAATLGNLGIQGANAGAGANMYGANAWQNAFGNLGNLGSFYAGLYQNQRAPYGQGYGVYR